MSAHKKSSIANHTVMVDEETFNLIERMREKTESKGDVVKRYLKRK